MTTRMLINATVADELRVAIVEDGELIDLDIESAERSSIRGNIYKGIVHNVEASLAAAFVNFGEHKQGFLPFDEISPELYPRSWDRKDDEPRITDVIKRGQEIIVQASKDAVGEKGAALSTYLSLPGRFTVLMPGSASRGVSRKIDDEKARKKVRALAADLQAPENCGYIVRTAGLGQEKPALQKDLDSLVQRYEKLHKAGQIARAPSLIYKEPDLAARTLRDLFTEEIDEVLIDTREEYEAAKEYFDELMPQFSDRIQFYQNPVPIFAYHHVEPQIEQTFERKVALPSGGSIIIDQTEALVAIDVNSGKMTSERDHEDTVYKTDYEAAQVIAQQLRLRDLGGIIVIDFIDMELARNKRAVEKALRDFTKSDKARVKMSRILSNGLCILTRQRIRAGLARASRSRCSVCDGTGWTRTPESHSLSLLKRIESRLAQGAVEEVRVRTHRSTQEFIVNQKRGELLALERQYRAAILVVARPELDRGADEVQFLSKGELLQEMTGLLPPREEKRRRGLAKKKRSKKSLAPDTSRAPLEKERPPKTRRPQETRRPPELDEGPRQPRPAEPEQSAGGITFTGRPPPEVLARIRAEAQARREAKAQRASGQPPHELDRSTTDPGAPRGPRVVPREAHDFGIQHVPSPGRADPAALPTPATAGSAEPASPAPLPSLQPVAFAPEQPAVFSVERSREAEKADATLEAPSSPPKRTRRPRRSSAPAQPAPESLEREEQVAQPSPFAQAVQSGEGEPTEGEAKPNFLRRLFRARTSAPPDKDG